MAIAAAELTTVTTGSVHRAWADRGPGVTRAWTMILLLTLLTITSFVDRYVMTLLVGDLHRDFGISDVQFGILVGPAFIVTYALVLFPVATLVDRFNRQYLIMAGTAIWSAMTLATAWATSFEQLVILRAGLAIGEAVLSPAAISLVGDLFVPAKRRLPMTVVVAGSQLGVAAAALFGALALNLATAYGHLLPGWLPGAPWRLVFVGVAILPLLVGTLYLSIAREPARGGQDADAAGAMGAGEPIGDHLRARWPLYAMAAIITACTALMGTLIPVWGPTFLHRSFGVPATTAGYALGSAFMIASFSGVIIFPAALKMLSGTRDVTRAMVRVCAIGLAFAIPAFLIAATTGSFLAAVIGFGVATFGVAISFPLPTQIIQLHTPAPIRARMGAAMLLVLFFFASGVGPVAVPWVARLFGRPEALGLPLILAAGAAGCSGLFFCWSLDRWLRNTPAAPVDVVPVPSAA